MTPIDAPMDARHLMVWGHAAALAAMAAVVVFLTLGAIVGGRVLAGLVAPAPAASNSGTMVPARFARLQAVMKAVARNALANARRA